MLLAKILGFAGAGLLCAAAVSIFAYYMGWHERQPWSEWTKGIK